MSSVVHRPMSSTLFLGRGAAVSRYAALSLARCSPFCLFAACVLYLACGHAVPRPGPLPEPSSLLAWGHLEDSRAQSLRGCLRWELY